VREIEDGMSGEEIALAFVDAVNAEDIERLGALMADGHVFTDALGNSFAGREKMLQGWRFFFAAYPSYRIDVEQVFSQGTTVALFGDGSGGWRVDGEVQEKRWKVRAAWLVEIEDGKVQRWSVFCDTGWIAVPNGK
jgi:ketosteroid isomerase-like protein